VRLYQEHVVPTTSRQGEFSSDDEQDGSARSDDGLKLNFEVKVKSQNYACITKPEVYCLT